MTTFESKVIIKKPVSEVYQFLTDMNNHQQLMPENVQNWTSSFDEAHFNIQNMTSLALKVENRIINKEIKIIAFNKPPFSVEIKWVLTTTDNATQAVFTLVADLNMMMKMLASGPLKKLADHQTETLTKIFI